MQDVRLMMRRVRRELARYRRPLSAMLAAVAVLAVIQTLLPAPPAMRSVAVAARDLSAGAVLQRADVKVEDLPPSAVPDGASTSSASMLGQVVAGPVRAGEVLTDRRLLGRSLLAGYPPGVVAAPVRVGDAAVARLLTVGDRIDVYASRRDTTAADRVVAGVRVVTLPAPAGDDQQGALVVLAVTPDQAAALAQASATAPLSLALLR